MNQVTATSIEAFRKDPQVYRALKDLLDGINETRRALEKGTYSAAAQYGKWGTIWCSALALRPGASSPTFSAGHTGYLPGFAAGNYVQGTVELPESFVAGDEFFPSLFFTLEGAPVAGNTFTWELRATVGRRDGNFPDLSYYSATYTANGGEQYRNIRVRFPFPRRSEPAGSVLSFQVALAAATSAQTPYLVGVSWAHRKNLIGLEDEP